MGGNEREGDGGVGGRRRWRGRREKEMEGRREEEMEG